MIVRFSSGKVRMEVGLEPTGCCLPIAIPINQKSKRSSDKGAYRSYFLRFNSTQDYCAFINGGLALLRDLENGLWNWGAVVIPSKDDVHLSYGKWSCRRRDSGSQGDFTVIGYLGFLVSNSLHRDSRSPVVLMRPQPKMPARLFCPSDDRARGLHSFPVRRRPSSCGRAGRGT